MSCMLKVLRAVCGPSKLFLLLNFCLNFGSLTFFLLREDLGKILKFQQQIHISDTWIINSSHDLSDLSSLNWRQIQLLGVAVDQLIKEKKHDVANHLCLSLQLLQFDSLFSFKFYQTNSNDAVEADETFNQNFTNPSKKNKWLLSSFFSFLPA